MEFAYFSGFTECCFLQPRNPLPKINSTCCLALSSLDQFFYTKGNPVLTSVNAQPSRRKKAVADVTTFHCGGRQFSCFNSCRPPGNVLVSAVLCPQDTALCTRPFSGKHTPVASSSKFLLSNLSPISLPEIPNPSPFTDSPAQRQQYGMVM